MIRQSYLAISVLFALSIFAHGAVLSVTEQSETAAMAGGAATSVAQLGNSFQDMVVGVMHATSAQETPADMPQQMDKVAEAAEIETPVEQSTSATSIVTQKEPIVNEGPSVETVQQTIPATIGLPSQATSDLAMKVAVPITGRAPLETTAPVEKTVSTALPQHDPSPRVSRRPSVRPKALEQRIAKTEAKRSTSKVQQPKRKAKQLAKGNAKTQAQAGVVDGRTTASAVVTGKPKSAKSTQAGNAVIANYSGLVFRKISRQKRPKTATKAVATVSFTIAANGSISRIGISIGSGSAELDQAAVALVQRAAPFPKPPNGAKKTYKVQVKGR